VGEDGKLKGFKALFVGRKEVFIKLLNAVAQ